MENVVKEFDLQWFVTYYNLLGLENHPVSEVKHCSSKQFEKNKNAFRYDAYRPLQ